MVNESIGKHLIYNGQLEESEKTTSFQVLGKGKISQLIEVKAGQTVFLEDHMEKISKQDPDIDLNKIRTNIYELIEKNEIENSYIKILIDKSSYLLYEAWVLSVDDQEQGVKVSLLDYDLKNENDQIIVSSIDEEVSRILMEDESFEVLIRNEEGQIIQGARSDLYFVKEGQVIKNTNLKRAEHLVSDKIEDLIEGLGKKILEGRIYDYQLLDVEGAFISGDSFGIAPIKTIESIELNSAENSLIQKLIEEYRELKESDIKKSLE